MSGSDLRRSLYVDTMLRSLLACARHELVQHTRMVQILRSSLQPVYSCVNTQTSNATRLLEHRRRPKNATVSVGVIQMFALFVLRPLGTCQESRTRPFSALQLAEVNKTTNELSAIINFDTTCQLRSTDLDLTTLEGQKYFKMAYNHRASQQFYGSQQQQQGRSRKKEDDSDALMRLVRFSKSQFVQFLQY